MSITISNNQNKIFFSFHKNKKSQLISNIKDIFNALKLSNNSREKKLFFKKSCNFSSKNLKISKLSKNLQLIDIVSKIKPTNQHLSINQESINHKIIGKEIW